MGKYAPLATHLRGAPRLVTMRFDEIETVIGGTLPPSAFRRRAWWGNDTSGLHIQATDGWLAAGRAVSRVDFDERVVTFVQRPRDAL